MHKKLLLLVACWLFTIGLAQAQVKKLHSDPLIWTDLQADYILSDQSFFFFRNQWRHNTDSDFAGIGETGPLSKFYHVLVVAGYDHRFSDHWSASVFARYTFDQANDNTIYQAALRHNGKISSLNFIKRLAFDIINPKIGDVRGRIRPFAALERNFTMGNHTVRPQLSYELFFYTDFKDQESTIKTRTVDRTRLRIAASYKVSPKLWLTPYFMKQTEYYNVLDTFTGELDGNGNQILKEAGGKRNRIDPIIGLDIRFILHPERITDETVPRLFR